MILLPAYSIAAALHIELLRPTHTKLSLAELSIGKLIKKQPPMKNAEGSFSVNTITLQQKKLGVCMYDTQGTTLIVPPHKLSQKEKASSLHKTPRGGVLYTSIKAPSSLCSKKKKHSSRQHHSTKAPSLYTAYPQSGHTVNSQPIYTAHP